MSSSHIRDIDISCRLAVTPAFSVPATTNLEHTFEHEYTEAETVTNSTPPTKKVARPETWKQNQRGDRFAKMLTATPLKAGNEACCAQKCTKQCHQVGIRANGGLVMECEKWNLTRI